MLSTSYKIPTTLILRVLKYIILIQNICKVYQIHILLFIYQNYNFNYKIIKIFLEIFSQSIE